jgi:PAS domain S-box-containing protein
VITESGGLVDDGGLWSVRSVAEGGRTVRRGPWIAFRSDDLEAHYWAFRRSTIYTLASAYLVTILATYLLGAFADFRLFGLTRTTAWLMPARGVVVSATVAVLLWVRRRPARRDLERTLLMWAILAAAVHGVIVWTRPPTYIAHMISGGAFLFLAYALLPSSWLLASATNFVAFLFYAVRIEQIVPAADFMTPKIIMWGMIAANGLAALWAVMNELDKRRQFVALCTEAETRRDLTNLKGALDLHALVTRADASGRITDVNDRFCAASKYSREELIGRDLRSLEVQASADTAAERWETIDGGMIWHGEVCQQAKDGAPFWVETTIVPLVDQRGTPQQYISLCTDITQRKAAKEALVAAKEAADDANRAKTEFLATMSHEIRTPMNGVLGFANLLADSPLNAEQQRFVATIRGSGELLLAIINDILDFSKIESGRLTIEQAPYDLPRAVQDVVELMSARASEKSLALSLTVTRSVPATMLGDAGRVRQVLVNLIGNAVKFTERGEIRVSIDVASEGIVRFAVRDTGIGLNDSAKAKLFQKFMQADTTTTRRFGGTGLGLAICKRLVEMMGGSIGVESEEGQGSTFWFTLPAPPADLHLQAPVVAAPVLLRVVPGELPPAGGRAPRVLLAEDNATNQFLAKRLLENLGCVVDVAGNGREAVDLSERLPYDVIFMDCQMPEMDGLEAAAAIRRRERDLDRTHPGSGHVYIVACTAGVMVLEQEACVGAGMDDFVAKPLVKDELRRALTRALRSATRAA